tara:strand:+ start:274 stop:663 length:390 start_codon:yes stop_codon:yes gene_type:complete
MHSMDRSKNKNYLYTENSDADQKTLSDFYHKVCDDCGEVHGEEAPPFKETPSLDMVNHPEHYNKGKYETYDVIVDTLGKHEAISYCQGNILKYIMRMWNKDKPLQDAEKAEWYLKAMIKLLKETKGVNW